MMRVLTFIDGTAHESDRLDPSHLSEQSAALVWVDLAAPDEQESKVLAGAFKFHELSIEDALSNIHHPKIESYPGYLYFILHGIDFQASQHHFATHDVDFFLGPRYLVTVHDGQRRSVTGVRELCLKNAHLFEDGVVGVAHRIIDALVDNYRPEVEKLRCQLDDVEEEVFENPDPNLMRAILALKRDVGSLRSVVLPQRDVVGRLARREFAIVSEGMAYRFRDVYDHLVRLSDEAMYFQDRISGLLDAHLSSVSNRLNQVMKVLTLIATVFMPLTVITGVYGMNVALPELPGGHAAQFWWVAAIMLGSTGLMVWFFRTRHWW